jgi:uncharacterized membrane protein (UPF0127 family)
VSHFLVPLVSSPDRVWGLQEVGSGRMLATHLNGAFDSATRKKGLLGREGLASGEGLVIAPCGGVHTFFMRFAIDVLFVARDGRVVKVRPAVKPWRLTFALRAFCAIELPAGVATTSGVRAGDRLALVASTGPTAADLCAPSA